MQSISSSEARRIALAAQQFTPSGPAPRNLRALTAIVRNLGVIQIDSVNVLVRSHYLPIFSRRGAYPPALLDRAAYTRDRTLFEYWGHEASLLPLECYPLFRWRMERARRGEGTWGRLRRYVTEHKALVANVLAQIRERGPLGASELEGAGRSSGAWWGWSQGKEILEWLFWTGEVTTAARRNFERLYDLPERVLPDSVRLSPTPAKPDAQRALMKIAARAHGVGTLRDLRDYFRLPTPDASERLAELVEEGALTPVKVEGWKATAYIPADAVCPRRVACAALLSPFDSLIWERERTERVFNFKYHLEIYTPAHKRRHGYYVLPFLQGDKLTARVDLKANRQGRTLEVRGGSVEAGESVSAVAPDLLQMLHAMAKWLQLERVAMTSRRGELMRALRKMKC